MQEAISIHGKISGEGDILAERSGRLLFEIISDIPGSNVQQEAAPAKRVQRLIRAASLKAGAVSATLSSPGGIIGVLTLLPDLASIWRIQAQLVSDIAAAHGKLAVLSRETMLHCLFKQAISEFARDIFVRTGTKIAVRALSSEALRKLLEKIGARVSSRILARGAARVVPVLGALGSGAYAAYDTFEVGKTAEAYFKELARP